MWRCLITEMTYCDAVRWSYAAKPQTTAFFASMVSLCAAALTNLVLSRCKGLFFPQAPRTRRYAVGTHNWASVTPGQYGCTDADFLHRRQIVRLVLVLLRCTLEKLQSCQGLPPAPTAAKQLEAVLQAWAPHYAILGPKHPFHAVTCMWDQISKVEKLCLRTHTHSHLNKLGRRKSLN